MKDKNIKEVDWTEIQIITTIFLALATVIIGIIALFISNSARNTSEEANKLTERVLQFEENMGFANLRMYFGWSEGKIKTIKLNDFIRPLTNKQYPEWEFNMINIGDSDSGAINAELINNWTDTGLGYFSNVPSKGQSFVNIRVMPKGMTLDNFEEYNLSKIPLGIQNLTFEIKPCYLCNERSRKLDIPICIYENSTMKETRCHGPD